jgi:ligand-binding SRPBCC domain-containing protein
VWKRVSRSVFFSPEDEVRPIDGEGDRVFETSQSIARPRREVFGFFSEPRNLEAITPPWLRFRIVDSSAPEIRSGAEFTYRMRLHGIPLTWRSLIAEWEPDVRFVDVQLQGPYSKWHHTHTFEEIPGGTRIVDRVVYRLPLGTLGRIVAGSLVDRDIVKVFRFRRERTAEILA